MKRIVALATLLSTTALQAPAQGVIELDEILVFGGLTPVLVSEYGRAFSTISAADIEKRQIAFAADALRALPGVSVNRVGALGNLTQVRIRGAEGNHTLVLIDGIRVSAPENGEFDFAGLTAADIERIEVLRGPQSSLYGSNAIGGVISITTKAGRAGTGGEARAEAGSDGTLGGSLSLRQDSGRLALGFSASLRDTGGFNTAAPSGGERDGDRNLTLSGRASYALTETMTLGITLRSTSRSGDYDDFNFGAATREDLVTDAPLVHDRDELFGAITVRAESLGGRLVHDLSFGLADMDDGNFNAGVRTTDTTSTRRTARYQAAFALDAATLDEADQTLTAAVEWERETFKANDPALVFDPSQLDTRARETVSTVLEYRGSFAGAFDVQLGLRHDDNDRFADSTTWSVGLSYRLPDERTRLHASAGTGAQNPTLFDQFGFIPGSFVGNPNLTPERSRGWDIGVERQILGGRGTIDVTYFEDRLTDEITTVFDPVTFESTPVNQAGVSRRKGVEVAGRMALGNAVQLGFGYTYLDARDPDGSREVRRPIHELGLDLGYRLPNERTEVNVALRHVAGLTDFDFTAPAFGGTKIGLADYTVVDVAVEHRLSDSLALTARINNLFDVRYQEVDGYDTQGRTAFAGVSTTW